VDLSVIAIWLGHESIVTTHMYLEADLAMKEKALAAVKEPKVKETRFRASEGLIRFWRVFDYAELSSGWLLP